MDKPKSRKQVPSSLICLSASVLACAIGFGQPISLSAAEAVPPAPAMAPSPENIDFFDSSSFDKELADCLAKKPSEAIVMPSGPFGPNQIPSRLEKWLSAISDGGGAVKLKKEVASAPPTRGVLADLIDLSVKKVEASERAEMYGKADGYDAILTYNGNDVTSVRFVKRPAGNP